MATEMKNPDSHIPLVNLFLLAVILTFSAGCAKTFKADVSNSYIDGKPTSTGGDVQPVINSLSPASGLPNTVVKILGIGFDQSVANNKVTINGVPAVVSQVDSHTVYITIPANATTGPIALTSGSQTVTTNINFKVLSPTVSTLFTLPGTTLEHITFDLFGDLIGESSNTLYQVSPSGTVSVIAGGDNTFKSLWGSAVFKGLGATYVADRLNAEILAVNSGKKVSVFAGGTNGIVDGLGTAAGFGFPVGLAIDANNNLYTTDTHRVRMITQTGKVTTLAGSASDGILDGKGAAAEFGSLQGIAIDVDNNVYVSDRKYLTIRKIDINNNVTTLAGTGIPGTTDGPGNVAQFTDPVGLAIDPAGNVLVADGDAKTGQYAIRVINKLGVVTTLLTGASLNQPDGMTFDPQGNLYISNTGSNTITKVTLK